MSSLFALVDCNNFFVSCERAFNPSLEGKPVVVLSSNDGCCVSRSDEAKALGIPMGVPLFKIKEVVSRYNVVTLSSNFELYGDMSRRVMQLLSEFVPTIEHYSIDEAFLPLPDTLSESYEAYASTIQRSILRATGIPVSIGIGTSRTLAKAANELAKRQPILLGICSFAHRTPEQLAHHLSLLPIESVWGIGRKSAAKLQKRGIMTAQAFVESDEQIVRKLLSITGLRTQLELKGKSCLCFSELRAVKKGICASRSFGNRITGCTELEAAVASYVDTACQKLRRQHSVARYMTVYIRSSHFSKTEPYYGASTTITLALATSYTPTLITHATAAVRKLYKPGIRYAKAGVFLTGISPETAVQQQLLEPQHNEQIPVHHSIMKAVDATRKKFGKHVVSFGAITRTTHWQVRAQHRSPRYTTHLGEVLSVC